MPNTNARKSRDWFLICSWAFFILAFVGLIVYMSVHVEDLLDSEMSSELILARQLKESGGIFSGNWYYSTEIRVLNTQLVYSLFFHAFEDWQTVRILCNITLYLLLLVHLPEAPGSLCEILVTGNEFDLQFVPFIKVVHLVLGFQLLKQCV